VGDPLGHGQSTLDEALAAGQPCLSCFPFPPGLESGAPDLLWGWEQQARSEGWLQTGRLSLTKLPPINSVQG
jgi:hypothetical protein